MANSQVIQEESANQWNLRDLVLVAGALFLVVALTYALTVRGQITAQFGDNLPHAIATLETQDYHALAFRPDNPNEVYFGHHQGILKSGNAGVSWGSVLGQGDAMALAVIADQPDTVIAAGHLVLIGSNDQGKSWATVKNDLPSTDIHGFAINPSNGMDWFGYIVGYGLYRSTNAGTNWTLVSKGLDDTTMALLVVPGETLTLYAGTMGKGVLKSTDGGVTWQSAKVDAKLAMTLAQDLWNPRAVYAGTENGLVRLSADGARWETLNLKKEIMAVAISPSKPSRILVVDGKGDVYRSDDGGNSWSGR